MFFNWSRVQDKSITEKTKSFVTIVIFYIFYESTKDWWTRDGIFNPGLVGKETVVEDGDRSETVSEKGNEG